MVRKTFAIYELLGIEHNLRQCYFFPIGKLAKWRATHQPLMEISICFISIGLTYISSHMYRVMLQLEM